MKKLLLLFIAGGFLTSCKPVQHLSAAIHPKTVEIELKTAKDVNYVNANEWMVEAFNNAESVIQFTDKEAGIVKGKYTVFSGNSGRLVHYGYGITNTVGAYEGVKATITVRVKDSLARLEIVPDKKQVTFLRGHKYYPNVGHTDAEYRAQINNLVQSFKKRMLFITNDF